MTRAVAFQMDPMEDVDIKADSSFHLAMTAQERGYSLYEYGPGDLAFLAGQVVARMRPMRLTRAEGEHVEFGPSEVRPLAEMDVVWLRQDPPFDMAYITSTHLLDLARPETLIVNDPFWVRNHPEKLLVLSFPDLIPPTAIARDLEMLRAFRDEHRDIIVKPLYGNGGAGVFRLQDGDTNLSSLYEMFTQISREPLIAQKFIPDVSAGDKRIILVDGEPIGAINRVPAEGETRSNMHVGGRPEKVALTERDREICEAIGPTLRDHGQIFVGIDVIGRYLTEINVTSPTGLQELDRFDGIDSAGAIWDAIEARL
ncbi:MAG: glutathione synthase [Shimia sp.]